MSCSPKCEFVRWRVEAIRFTQSDTRYLGHQLQGGAWVEVELPPPPGPTPELPIQSVVEAIKVHVKTTYRLVDSDGRCRCGDEDEAPCRCVRTGKYVSALKWSLTGGFPCAIPPLGGPQYWMCRIDYDVILTKYRAPGECIPASLPGSLIERPDDD